MQMNKKNNRKFLKYLNSIKVCDYLNSMYCFVFELDCKWGEMRQIGVIISLLIQYFALLQVK